MWDGDVVDGAREQITLAKLAAQHLQLLVLLFSFEGGLVQRVLALPSDPDAFEAFWA